MPVPSSISDLSTTPSLNSPAGTESPSTVDDYLRTQAAFIRQVDDKATGTVKAADLAATGGAALVGYDGGTAQDVLDNAKPMANYTALRAYTGRATGVRITQAGLAGFFQRDDADTTSADNGGTVIVDGADRRWKRRGCMFVTPEMFGAKANETGFDSTAALNSALATGVDVYGDATSTFYVSDVIEAKGQSLVGGFKISSSKKIRPDFTGPIGSVDTYSQDIIDPDNIKFCFVQRSHDLVEFLKIKSLGFNTILHYDLYNAGGDVNKVLNNAKTAGLRVIIGTENRSADVDTQVAFWSDYDSHPALYAYSLFDEPAARGISVATQESKVAKYRAMTQKPLTVTENYVDSLSILPFIKSFDIYFLHAYARNWMDVDVNVKVSKDLALARKSAAFLRSVYREKRIVPVVGLFVSSTADGMSNNQTQINTFAGVYGKANNGSLGVFIWDVLTAGGAIQDNLGNNASFQETWLTCSQAESPLRQSAICFGKGSSTAYDFGMGDLVNSALRTFDTSYAQNTNAWPVALSSGGSETLFATAVASQVGYSGIAFKTTSATYHSSIRIGRYGTIYAWLVDMTSAFVGTINMYLSADNGVTKTLVGTTTDPVIDLTFSNPFASDAVLIIEVTSTSAASANFRRFMRGVIMSSEW